MVTGDGVRTAPGRGLSGGARQEAAAPFLTLTVQGPAECPPLQLHKRGESIARVSRWGRRL